MIGSCRFSLWFVEVEWDKYIIYGVRFKKTELKGQVPLIFTQYLAGKSTSFKDYTSPILSLNGVYGDIYREVYQLPYGTTITYGDISKKVKTSPRVVGLAMKRNPVPLIIPCHRVVSTKGIGGFTPDVFIKEELLKLEQSVIKKI